MEFLRQYLDIGIFAILGLMSFFALAYVVERFIYFSRIDVARYQHVESLRIDLNRGMTVIASVASNAPYVGLLGTVFGIMLTVAQLLPQSAERVFKDSATVTSLVKFRLC